MPKCRSICGKPDDFVLPRPFDGQITKARDPQAAGQMPIDCGFDEIGRKESQRYRHVDLTGAASSAVGDALGRGRRILDQLLEPTARLRNRSNQCRFRLRPDGPRTLVRWVSVALFWTSRILIALVSAAIFSPGRTPGLE